MLILQDHREKHGHHTELEEYLKQQGYTIKRVRLEVGDYMFPNGKVSVDLKGGGLEELASDLHRDKLSFNKKYKKCLKYGIELIVLVEEWVDSINTLSVWKSSHSRITGRYLVDLIHDIQVSYGVRFVFCDKKNTGETLIKLLKGSK